MVDLNINIYKGLLKEFQKRSNDLDKHMNNVIVSADSLEKTYIALKITHDNIQRESKEKYNLENEKEDNGE